MKVAVFSSKSYDIQFLDEANKKFGHELTYFETRLRSRTVNLTRDFDAVCVFVNDRLDEETIEVLAEYNCKAIVLRSAGFNNVNLEKAFEKKIRILRVPAYSPEAVAEHALALILTLNRKTHKAYNRVREGNFSLERLTGFNLHKKVIGVVGTGRIGSVFCKIMIGMGCEVIAFDRFQNQELIHMGVKYLNFEDLLKKSDIISLHCPLTSETHHIINSKALDMMKKGAMLINTSRGALVNTHDVVNSLKDRRLGYLGIDVYEQEEKLFFKDLSETIIQDDLILRLVGFPNVLITSHQAFFTSEALEQIAYITMKNIQDVKDGVDSENEIKPSALKS